MNLQTVYTWLQSPANDVLALTYAIAILQAVHAQTKWAWAGKVAEVLAALPGLNLAGLISACGPTKKAP